MRVSRSLATYHISEPVHHPECRCVRTLPWPPVGSFCWPLTGKRPSSLKQAPPTRRRVGAGMSREDVLWLDGTAVTSTSLAGRRALLEHLIPAPTGAWQ